MYIKIYSKVLYKFVLKAYCKISNGLLQKLEKGRGVYETRFKDNKHVFKRFNGKRTKN